MLECGLSDMRFDRDREWQKGLIPLRIVSLSSTFSNYSIDVNKSNMSLESNLITQKPKEDLYVYYY